MTYHVGDSIRCAVLFTNTSQQPVDPTAVYFKVRSPDGTVTTYQYGTNVQLVKDSAGAYHVDVNGSVSGLWRYKFYSTGTGQAAVEETFFIEPTVFA